MKLLPATTEVFFKKAVSVAEHYGFRNIDDLRFEASKRGTSVLDLQKQDGAHKHFEQHILRAVLEKCNQTVQLKKKQPLMFYTPSLVSHPSMPSVRISTLSLNAVGTADPLAEVVLIKSATSILEELGLKSLRVSVNSIGDNDSSARFIREITGLLRARSSDLNESEAHLLRTDPSALIAELFTERHPITESMPSPLDFLTTPSRRHFKELLELLDYTGIPFDLDERLYSDQRVYSHTLFEIRDDSGLEKAEPSQPLARGGRYDELTRPYVRGSVPSTGVVIAARTKNERKTVGRPRRRKPNACLVHIGREARIRSIGIIETFRKEKIAIEQCLQYERFSEQMAYAEAMHTKYIIIIGQREARDGVVLLRDADSRSQTTVRIDQLPGVFKGLTV